MRKSAGWLPAAIGFMEEEVEGGGRRGKLGVETGRSVVEQAGFRLGCLLGMERDLFFVFSWPEATSAVRRAEEEGHLPI